MKVETYPDREMMMLALADVIAGEINRTLMRAGRASFAVPGGTTPGPIFDALSGTDIAWDRVDVILTDERLVAPDSPRSNERQVRERLLVGRAAAARFLRLVPAAADADLGDLIAELAPRLPLSVMLLGMAESLHVASLFAEAPEIRAALGRDAPPLMVTRPPSEPEACITLTGPVLRSALSGHILMTGTGKRAALEAAGNDPTVAPVAAVLGASRVHWAE